MKSSSSSRFNLPSYFRVCIRISLYFSNYISLFQIQFFYKVDNIVVEERCNRLNSEKWDDYNVEKH